MESLLTSISFFQIGLIVILIILLLLQLYFFFKRKSENNKIKKNPRFDEAMYLLNLIISQYRYSEFEKKIKQARSKYETDPRKPEASTHLFLDECDKIIKTSVKEIISSISNESKNILLLYFSDKGLLDYIIFKLNNSD